MRNVEKRNISDLKLLEDNPRQITKENMERLKRDMQDDPEFLEKRPVLVNKKGEDYIVYAGNMRVRAAQELGWTEIPAIIDENLDEATMRKRALRDNQEYGEWDKDILANAWEDEIKLLDLPELNLDNLRVGNILDEIDTVLVDDDRMKVIEVYPPETPKLKEKFYLICDTKDDYDKIKGALKNEVINSSDIVSIL